MSVCGPQMNNKNFNSKSSAARCLSQQPEAVKLCKLRVSLSDLSLLFGVIVKNVSQQ